MCVPEAFPEGSMTDLLFGPWEWGFFHLPYTATTSCCISQMSLLSLQMSVLLLSSLLQCCPPVQQRTRVLCPCALSAGRFQGKVFSWCKGRSSTEIEPLPVCVYQVFMAYLMCRLRSTDFLCCHGRTRSLFLHDTEIHDLHFLNAMKGIFKVLISMFIEFNCEEISACTG